MQDKDKQELMHYTQRCLDRSSTIHLPENVRKLLRLPEEVSLGLRWRHFISEV